MSQVTTLKVAEHRSRWKLDKRLLAGLFWRRWSHKAEAANWGARYKSWLGKHSASIYPNRFSLYRAVRPATFRDGHVTLLEFGVADGDSLREWAKINDHPESRFYGFDSWQGLPPDDPPYDDGAFDLAEMPAISDSRIHLRPGWFHETLPPWMTSNHMAGTAIVHIDCDGYRSTLYVLTKLNDRLGKGDVIVFDELSCAQHEFRALIDWAGAYQRTYDVLGCFRSGRRIEGAAIRLKE